MFDFSKVDAAKGSTYIRPGMWRLTPSEAILEQPENGNPRLNVTFTHKDGSSFKERFVITPKALSRLQYLHEAAFGKKLEKAFTSVEQLGEYFKKALLGKPKELLMVVGGEVANDGKVYARLPFTGFIVLREDLFEEGIFEEGSPRYNEVVKRRDGGPVMSTNSAVLPSDDDDSTDDSDSGMPW